MGPGTLTRWGHLTHRWLGVGLGGLVFLWLISGLVMLYVPRPALDEAERVAGLPPLDQLAGPGLRLSPAAAWRSLGLAGQPRALRLNGAGGRPAYRILSEQGWWVVDAQTGATLAPPDGAAALSRVRAYVEEAALHGANLSPVTVDQWTVYRHFDALRPFWQVSLADGREYYVSTRTGEVVLATHPAERAWNWLGSVIHWLYFTPLRAEAPLWRQVVLWSSFLATGMVALGLWLGVQRLRWRKPYRDGRHSPYREAWKRWHHWLGLGAGGVVLTWLLSGWLSMAPLGLAAAPALPGGTVPRQVTPPDTVPDLPATVREIVWQPLGQVVFRRDILATGSRIQASGGPGVAPQPPAAALSLAGIEAAVGTLGGAGVKAARWLTGPDDRYYPLGHTPRAFPVVRLELDDSAGTVLYVSPVSAKVERVGNHHDWAHRWLYQGLHRLDFPPLTALPGLREGAVIVLSLAGLGLGLTGLVLAWRRLRGPRGRRGDGARGALIPPAAPAAD